MQKNKKQFKMQTQTQMQTKVINTLSWLHGEAYDTLVNYIWFNTYLTLLY